MHPTCLTFISTILILVAGAGAKSFNPVTFPNGTAACAGDASNFSLSPSDVDAALPSLTLITGILEVVRCAYYCTALAAASGGAGCVGFNYWSNYVTRCEFYTTMPTICAPRSGCSYHSNATDTAFCYPVSCKQILSRSSITPNGQYLIHTSTSDGRIIQVYCDMTLNGGGYTFINPVDVPLLTDAELQAIFTDKTSFLFRASMSDQTQRYGVLQQTQYNVNTPLKIGLNQHTDYAASCNEGADLLGPKYLYFGFVPAAAIANRTIHGMMVNGNDLVNPNCDANPSSYMVFFTDTAGKQQSTTAGSQSLWPLWRDIVNALLTPTQPIPTEYFMFMESAIGGCGYLMQTDGGTSTGSVAAATIGFR